LRNSGDVKSLDYSVINSLKSLNDYDKFVVEFIEQLVQRRIELGFTQRKLAEISGIKQSAIARLEMCKSSPQLDTLYKITKHLNLKLKLIPDELIK